MVTHPGLANGPIYLDYNATTPVDPLVVEAMFPYLSTQFGNPSSTHTYAKTTHAALDHARAQVAQLLGCASDEIVFTGGGSESDTLAIRGVALANRSRGNHIITQVTEHPAVLNVCRALTQHYGMHVTYLPVDEFGRVQPQDVKAALNEQTILVSIMSANNETGTIQPIAEIAQIVHSYSHDIGVHTDAAQVVGKIPVDVGALGVDLLTVAGHKLYAPKGVGALYVRRGWRLEPAIYGGGQEAGRRAGTENVAFAVALGMAAQLAAEQLPASTAKLRALRDDLYQQLAQVGPESVHLNGHVTKRLPNTLNVSIDGIIGEEILAAIPSIASSTGSACHEGSTEPSSVLLAMGLSRERALGALRLTLGRWSTREEVTKAAILLIQTVDSFRNKQ
ncbi:MAG TPA: cysteine desulfurase family protein [Ktedonobacteraceae bacterium]|jgi:cysteine desulfurase|nr:cysteine desulfurase family protein [Ktedonobacteraceae bacterium]